MAEIKKTKQELDREKSKRWYDANKERKIAYTTAYYQAHKDECAQRIKNYHKRNPNYHKEYREKNPDKFKKYHETRQTKYKIIYEKNCEKAKAYSKHKYAWDHYNTSAHSAFTLMCNIDYS